MKNGFKKYSTSKLLLISLGCALFVVYPEVEIIFNTDTIINTNPLIHSSSQPAQHPFK